VAYLRGGAAYLSRGCGVAKAGVAYLRGGSAYLSLGCGIDKAGRACVRTYEGVRNTYVWGVV
jgi:hypothetical protein